MKFSQLTRFKKIIGAPIFNIFFPNENKRLEQNKGIGKQYDLVLTFVPVGRQTAARNYIIDITGWTQKKATAFLKEGDYPKVIMYNISSVLRSDIAGYLTYIEATDGIIIKIY